MASPEYRERCITEKGAAIIANSDFRSHWFMQNPSNAFTEPLRAQIRTLIIGRKLTTGNE
jgi:hypothetical protein